MNREIVPLNSAECPLEGVCMVEAAAGTGKTYNIQNLFLRLLLERELPVSSILVVTYTEAATAELRSRIRDMLRCALDFLEKKNLPEQEAVRISALIANAEKTTTQELLKRRLRDAMLDFDNATIATIHGFCQRMLAENAFESGVLFNTEIEQNPDEIIHDILTDFYRREYYSGSNSRLRSELCVCGGFSPEEAFREISVLLARPELKIQTRARAPYDTRPILDSLALLLEQCAGFYEEGLLVSFGDIMNKGYKPEDRAAADALLLEWKRTGELSGVLEVLMRHTPEMLLANIAKRSLKQFDPRRLDHPFFTACREIVLRIQDYKDTVLFAALEFTRARFEERKRRDNFQTFDDLLRRVRDGILREEGTLAPAIRRKFKAAVVDEFQDTDPVQYDIFHRLFACRRDPAFFMVGDPRQAIYAFRGGDIAAYRLAERECLHAGGRKYGLTDNYRSSAPMIRAVNRIFLDHPFPFADSGISFSEIHAPADRSGNVRGGLLRNGTEEEHPLRVVLMPPREKIPTACQLGEETLPACADEILRMLSDASLRLPGRESDGIRPEDIAVLVFNSYEAERMHALLAARRIPAVLAQTGNVFDSEATEELETVLEAIASPSDLSLAVRAMQTGLIGYELPALTAVHQADGSGDSEVPLDGIPNELEELARIWEQGSFVEMFQEFLNRFRVKERLLGEPCGERKLTDLLHLREVLHERISRDGLSLAGGLNFLKRQRSERLRDKKDEYEIQLETDRAAVTIMTIHKSKGLEFPVVLLPALFSRSAEKHAENYHLPDGSIARDYTGNEEAAALGMGEQLQELLRLAYVAITRAKYACVLFWGACSVRTTALDWLFRMRDLPELPPVDALTGALERCYKDPLSSLPPEWIDRFVPTETPHYYVPEQRECPELRLPRWQGRIDSAWCITSYSGLTSSGKDAGACDYDAFLPEKEQGRGDGIFGFPGGAQTGNAWHAILESIDFEQPETEMNEIVTRALDVCGLLRGTGEINAERIALTTQMVKTLLAHPLPGKDGGTFSLSMISRRNRISEMEFHSCFHSSFSMRGLHTLLEPYLAERFGRTAPALWSGEISGGYLNGFIDLIFQRDGMFYLADWKSNRLGASALSYRPEHVEHVMLEQNYYLQYLIYSVALMKFLRLRSGTFGREEYERRFGGVYYFFLRGLTPEIPENGVFFDRPPLELLTGLEGLIG